ncbi:hypothetical protein ACVWZA_003532 [Sphingomonas sp. UYAg733]
MAYSIHIVRHDKAGNREPIEVREWVAAVSALDGVRLASSDVTASNPVSGENIVIKRDDADAELHDEQQNAWLPVFRWSEHGSVSFNAPSDFDEATSRVRMVAGELARNLSAELVGDEGEFYL